MGESPAAERVVRRATFLPLTPDARLEVLHVVADGRSERVPAEALRAAEDQLERAIEWARTHNVP